MSVECAIGNTSWPVAAAPRQSRRRPDAMTKADSAEYVERYSDLILRLSFTYLGSSSDAEDIVQDVLIKLMLNAPPFSSPEHEKAWVIRTTVNRCKDVLKGAHRKRSVRFDETTPHPTAPSAEEVFMSQQSGVLDAVNQLPEDQRVAVFLHYYEDMSIAQIASIENKSVAAVTKRLSRAREALRKAIERSHHDVME